MVWETQNKYTMWSIDQWTNAFIVYMTIKLEKDWDLALLMLHYLDIICTAVTVLFGKVMVYRNGHYEYAPKFIGTIIV